MISFVWILPLCLIACVSSRYADWNIRSQTHFSAVRALRDQQLMPNCEDGEYIDTRRDGFLGNLNVTLFTGRETGIFERQPHTSRSTYFERGHRLEIRPAFADTIFTIEEICIESKGIGGLFWEYEEPAPEPKVSQFGSSWFISAVGGSLHHSVTSVNNPHRWAGSCVTYGGRLQKISLSPMVLENHSLALIRQLAISACLKPSW